jgi:hypothetical protein
MTLSHSRLSQLSGSGQAQQLTTPAASLGAGAQEPEAAQSVPVSYGSTPSAVVSVSAQAKALQAKAYAIKHGHDPDGLQDGK